MISKTVFHILFAIPVSRRKLNKSTHTSTIPEHVDVSRAGCSENKECKECVQDSWTLRWIRGKKIYKYCSVSCTDRLFCVLRPQCNWGLTMYNYICTMYNYNVIVIDSYVRMLFIDFSSAFNTIIPQQLTHKLAQLGLNTSLCNWLLDFLTGRPQAVRVGINPSSTITLNTGAPQGYVLSPLLFTLLTHDCTPSHNSNLFIKFADDTTVVGLISNRDETNYRSEVSRLAGWCRVNNLSLNVEKTKEIVVDFRRVHTQHAPLTINGVTVERASSTKFLGVHITDDLSWTNNTAALAKKAQQRLYFLRKLRRARAPTPIMCTFYRGTIESILTSCCVVWRLQRVLPQVPSTDSESSWEDRWCLSPLPPEHLQHSSHPQSPQHCRWSHPPDTQLLQSAAIREETAESPGEDQQTEGQLHPSGCQEAELPPVLAPPPLLYPTQHWTLTLRPPPPNVHPPSPPPPPLQLWPAPVTLCSTGMLSTSSSIVCNLPLLTVW